jgi:hypothetical protein
MIGLTTFLIGLLADLVSFNRRLLEMTLQKVRRLELALGSNPQAHRAMEAVEQPLVLEHRASKRATRNEAVPGNDGAVKTRVKSTLARPG